MNYYVLACETGREEKNIRLLESTVKRLLPGAYVKGYSPVRESREFCARSWSMKLRPLIPGYVIVVSDGELWRIRKEIFMISDTCSVVLGCTTMSGVLWKMEASNPYV